MQKLIEDLKQLPAFVDRNGYTFSGEHTIVIKTAYKRYIVDAWSFIDDSFVIYDYFYLDKNNKDIFIDFANVVDYRIIEGLTL
jgi:hypothetical protein